jgi:hypothetical protein
MYIKLHNCRVLLSKVKGVGTLMTRIVNDNSYINNQIFLKHNSLIIIDSITEFFKFNKIVKQDYFGDLFFEIVKHNYN